MQALRVMFMMALATLAACTALVAATSGQTDARPWYLFTSFRGNGEDGLHLAYSLDGLKWKALNRGRSLLKPEVGNQKLMRDPSITRGPEGTFHMVWTVSWNDRVIGYARSKDLIHWSAQRAIPVMAHEPAARNCWAPEVFYDEATRQFLIFWATTIPGRFPETAASSETEYNHRIYLTTTRDFKTFAATKPFYDPGFNCIDAFLARDGDRYAMFLKDETLKPRPRKLILLATADRAAGPYGRPSGPITDQTWVEGPSAIKIGGTWLLYFDCYRKGRYGAAASKDLKTWRDVSDRIEFPQGTRHGTALRVDRPVLDRLLALPE